MNYDSMSIVELKQAAKARRIKMYYTKKRIELIHLLSMPSLPDAYTIEKLTIVELRQEAKTRGLRGFWGLSRDEIVQLLYPDGRLPHNVDKEPKNSHDTQKCKDPQPYESD